MPRPGQGSQPAGSVLIFYLPVTQPELPRAEFLNSGNFTVSALFLLSVLKVNFLFHPKELPLMYQK